MSFNKFFITIFCLFQTMIFTREIPSTLETALNSASQSVDKIRESLNSLSIKTCLPAMPSLNYKALVLSSCFFTAALGLGYLLWTQIDKENMGYKQQFKEKVDELNAAGIKVTEERWGSLHEIKIHKPHIVSHETEQLIERIKPELIRIRDEQYNRDMTWNLKNCAMISELLGMFTFFRLSWYFFIKGIYQDQSNNL